MESGMLKAFDDRDYSAAIPSDAYSSEGSTYPQTSPEYDSKSIGNADDCRWGNGQNIQLIKNNLKEELTEVSDDEAERSSCEEDEGVYNEYEESPEELPEEQVDIDSDDYDIEIEYPGETINENGDIIHVFTVDPDKVIEYSSDEESQNVEDWHVENPEQVIEESIVDNETEDEEYIDTSDVQHAENNLHAIVQSEKQAEEYHEKEQTNKNDSIESTIEANKEFNIDKSFEGEINVDDFLVKTEPKSLKTENELFANELEDEIPIFSPNIDEMKRLFSTPTKSGRNIQKSFSLPHSPSRVIQEDEGRTSFSFEDNLNTFEDLSFEANGPTKMFDILDLNNDDDEIRTLNDDDINSFLIKPKIKSPAKTDTVEKVETALPVVSLPTLNYSEKEIKVESCDRSKSLSSNTENQLVLNKIKENQVKINQIIEDDLSQQDMEIEYPVYKSIKNTVNINEVAIPKFSSPPKKYTEPLLVKANLVRETKPTAQQNTPLSNEKPKNVLSFCVEKPKIKSEIVKIDKNNKYEQDDFVDVESLNDSIEIPVLEANNVKSLLEQFEANEKFSNPSQHKGINRITVNKESSPKSLPNGLRFQEAAIQLNKNKMRQILMPTPNQNCDAQKPMQDHDYCSPNKRIIPPHSLQFPPKRRQSLLKPEVVTSNHIIKSTRHRTCKSKKVVYALSSDDEDAVKQSDKKDIKNSLISNHRKKLSPNHECDTHSVKPKQSPIESGVVISSASDPKLSDSQCNGGSIKLTIKNKTQVILKLDDKNKPKQINPNNVIKISEIKKEPVIPISEIKSEIKKEPECKKISEITLLKSYNKIETVKPSNVSSNKSQTIASSKKQITAIENFNAKPHSIVKKELQKIENVKPLIVKPDIVYDSVPQPYFKKDLQKIENVKPPIVKPEIVYDSFVPQPFFRNRDPLGLMASIENEKEEALQPDPQITESVTPEPEPKQPAKKKLNLQEYKLRKEGNSNNSSRTVSPELALIANQDIFYIQPTPNKEKLTPAQVSPSLPQSSSSSNNTSNRSSPKDEVDESKKVFDPIREASRKILLQSKRQKVEAIRKRDEEMVMRKIPKIENLELKPLISDVEIMTMVTIANQELQKQNAMTTTPEPPKSSEYEEIIMVSIGVNTDINEMAELNDTKKDSPSNKSAIQFTIKKLDQNVILKQNVFDVKKKNAEKGSPKRKSTESESRPQSDKDKTSFTKDIKIDKERYKDITATLKSVESNADVKISSNSLFASIQDTVMKKAPEPEKPEKKSEERKRPRSEERHAQVNHAPKKRKTLIVDQTPKEEHGEDKVILHLSRDRVKPQSVAVKIQTDTPMFTKVEEAENTCKPLDNSEPKIDNALVKNVENKASETPRSSSKNSSRRSLSRERDTRISHERKIRSYSRGRSRSRHRSRSSERRYRRRYSPYRRRSKSPYKRSRSPYKRSERRYRQSERSNSRHRSLTKTVRKQSKSPVRNGKRSLSSTCAEEKRSKSPETGKENGRVTPNSPSRTPPLRKQTVSESSDSSSCSSSSSSSRYSRSPSRSYRTPSPPRYLESCDDRQCIPPVEERRIVYVGKLETDITKASLRNTFAKFGPITEVTLHTKDNGSRYGFVTYRRGRDAWGAVEGARARLPHYDVGFGGRRAFCRQRYADLDGLEAEYRENDYLTLPSSIHKSEDISFEVLLQETKKKLSKMKKDMTD